MNPYANYTLNQLLTVITEGNPLENTAIDEVFKAAWNKTLTERDGILFVRVLRKTRNYHLSEDYHEKLNIKYPNSAGLKSEALWLKFSSEVCNRDNSDFCKDAQQILDQTSQNNPGTKLIYEITALRTISRLIENKSFNDAYIWTTKLNPLILNEKVGKGINGKYYASHRQQFYGCKARCLIELDRLTYYVNWVFEHLKFTVQKRKEFVEYIVASCTSTNFDGEEYYSSFVFSNYLYKFDVDLTSNTKYLPNKTIQSEYVLLSELSQFLFCPVSFALNQNFHIPELKAMDSSSNWTGNKDGFYDRYLRYQQSQNIVFCFQYNTLINFAGVENVENAEKVEMLAMEDGAVSIFEELFNGSIEVNNSLDNTPRTFNSDNDQLKGAPDYLIILKNGKRVIISEKFSANSSVAASKIFNSDIINLEAYLLKFKNLKIDFAYFISWNWAVDRVNNMGEAQNISMAYVNKVKIHKIELGNSRDSLIDRTVEKINILKLGNALEINDVSFPSKCLKCSVYRFCDHKSGTKEGLRLPYNNYNI